MREGGGGTGCRLRLLTPDRKFFSDFFLLPITQLSYIAEDENGKIVGYVLAKM